MPIWNASMPTLPAVPSPSFAVRMFSAALARCVSAIPSSRSMPARLPRVISSFVLGYGFISSACVVTPAFSFASRYSLSISSAAATSAARKPEAFAPRFCAVARTVAPIRFAASSLRTMLCEISLPLLCLLPRSAGREERAVWLPAELFPTLGSTLEVVPSTGIVCVGFAAVCGRSIFVILILPDAFP